MKLSLKNHPFSVEAFFESSIVITFAFPKEDLENLIPDCLELETFEDKWAFLAVAMVQTKNLKPKGFPKFLGNDFFLIGYRVFVRYKNKKGKRLRGLYILKSETDSKRMELAGNIFTHYNYSTTDIKRKEIKQFKKIYSEKSNFQVTFNKNKSNISLPENSPFSTWKEARKFAGPLPFTFTFNKEKNEVLIIEGVRKNWKPKPIEIIDSNFSFIKNLGFATGFFVAKPTIISLLQSCTSDVKTWVP